MALWVLGPQLELAVGRVRFLALYFISGLAGSALVLAAGPQFGGTHGASGAIFGLMGALLVLAYKVGGDVRGVLTWIGINFLITFVFVQHLLAGAPRRLPRRPGLSPPSSSTRRAARSGRRSRRPGWPASRVVVLVAIVVRIVMLAELRLSSSAVVHSWGEACGELQRV